MKNTGVKNITKYTRARKPLSGYLSGTPVHVKSAINYNDMLHHLGINKRKKVVPEIQDGDKIGVVDDLITTSGSKTEACDLVRLEAKRRNINVDVIGVYVLLDREQGGRETLQREGLELYSVTTIREAAKCLKDLGILTSQLYNIINDYTVSQRENMGLK